jgi:DNA-binding transcriptional MerR regulator
MNYYSIAAVSQELGVHGSSLRRWEKWNFIFPARMRTGKATVRIFSEDDLTVLRRAKELMDDGMDLEAAFDSAYNDFMNLED